MRDAMMDDNCVNLMGLMKTTFIYDHDGDSGCKIYGAELEIRRRNYRYPDIVPITASDKIVDVTRDYTGQQVQVTGILCPYDAKNSGSGKHNLSVAVHKLETTAMPERFMNEVVLKGSISKKPTAKKTHYGHLVTEFVILAEQQGKEWYVPCFIGGRNVLDVAQMDAGVCLEIMGAISSRTYAGKSEMDQSEIYHMHKVRVKEYHVVS